MDTPKRKKTSLLQNPDYDPNRLFDAMLVQLILKNDGQLARVLEVAPPVISKMRHRHIPIGPALLLRLHAVTDLHIRDILGLMMVAK